MVMDLISRVGGIMAKRLRLRFTLEAVLGAGAAALGLLTLFWQDWIEAIFGYDPDQHSGSVEWLVVAGLLVLAAVLGVLARADWHRLAASAQLHPDPNPTG
jgi:hypothetical protein